LRALRQAQPSVNETPVVVRVNVPAKGT
jgi:hypothetical protein